MAEGSPDDAAKRFRDIEKGMLEAFERWHRFHEDLLKLGDFSNWLSESENQVDLVTFFALDKDSGTSYRQALEHQKMFLSAIQQLLEQIETMFDEYESAKGAGGEDAG